ncbi:CRISPR-associated endonuclease Cas2 [Lewinella aquimaris]|uniref:CRISPR-associated endoribonuclease Cas2 n=1 Tax=Neolewinella aquimaris TaxID=1835722 RepID=A0A840E7P3_9BACT|nr:CRISPR-associated endonuclease Cas2 [Neolewinella aquimaris]MBB4079752.1 CRISPR-associated endonuclease Cas2 [Neolewinella aquimaris]
MQTHLISYDISDNNLRLKAAKFILRAGGYRIQHSVFMGTFSKSILLKLEEELLLISNLPRWTPDDSLLLLPLHEYSKRELSIIGKVPEDWGLINREIHTLVL